MTMKPNQTAVAASAFVAMLTCAQSAAADGVDPPTEMLSPLFRLFDEVTLYDMMTFNSGAILSFTAADGSIGSDALKIETYCMIDYTGSSPVIPILTIGNGYYDEEYSQIEGDTYYRQHVGIYFRPNEATFSVASMDNLSEENKYQRAWTGSNVNQYDDYRPYVEDVASGMVRENYVTEWPFFTVDGLYTQNEVVKVTWYINATNSYIEIAPTYGIGKFKMRQYLELGFGYGIQTILVNAQDFLDEDEGAVYVYSGCAARSDDLGYPHGYVALTQFENSIYELQNNVDLWWPKHFKVIDQLRYISIKKNRIRPVPPLIDHVNSSGALIMTAIRS